MNSFHCAFCVFGYIHVMKRSLLYFLLLVSIFSCSKPEHKPDKQREESIALIQEYTKKNFMQIAKLHHDIQDDDFNAQVYSAAKNIYDKCDSTHLKLLGLKSEPNRDVVRLKSQEYFDEFINTVNTTPNTNYLKDIPPLEKATSDLDNNILSLWIFGTKCMVKLSNNLTAFCGVVDEFELVSNTERKDYRLGDTIHIITFFDKDRKPISPSLHSEKPLLLREVKFNNSIIKPQNLNSRFNNGYIEFIPTKAGKYEIILTKDIERASGKIVTYESKVEFTVLP